MRQLLSLTFVVLLLANASHGQSGNPSRTAAENIQQSPPTAAKLTNRDVVELLRAGMTTSELLTKIRASEREFDTSEAALKVLKDEGVPPPVIELMQGEIPTADPPQVPVELVIPVGTQLDIEARYTVSSLDVHAGELISFRVLVPIKVDGVIVVDKGALVTARVVGAKRGGHWGKAGRLTWAMQDVLAVDGSRVPLRFGSGTPETSGEDTNGTNSDTNANKITGTSHSGEVITKTIITGAIFPPLAPLGLIHGFRRGENAVLSEGKRYFAFVGSNATVTAKR